MSKVGDFGTNTVLISKIRTCTDRYRVGLSFCVYNCSDRSPNMLQMSVGSHFRVGRRFSTSSVKSQILARILNNNVAPVYIRRI